MARRGCGHAADHGGRSQRTHAVLHGDQFGVGRQRREPVFYRVEAFRAACDDGVRRHVETGREIVPEFDVLLRQYGHDLRPGHGRGEIVDRARQYGHSAEECELLGACASCAASAASGYDDDSRAFHTFILGVVRRPQAGRANPAA